MALPTPPGMKESVSVGKVLSLRSKGEGNELELRWYMPVRVDASGKRSRYGKGRWTPEFVVESGKLVASVGFENLAAVAAKFLKLTSQGKLPSHVWKSVAESTLPAEDVDEEEEEEGEDFSLGGARGFGESASPVQPAWPQLPQPQLPQLPRVPVDSHAHDKGLSGTSQPEGTPVPARAVVPANVALTAAHFRPRR